jgi:pimeloyl-ACP methyl ester carboxylesterase
MYVESNVRRLFLYGEQNRRKREALSTSEAVVEIPNAGHFMLADNPQDTLRVINNFLSKK